MDMGVLSLLGILLAMALFIVGVYKGFPIMIIGPVSAVVVLLFSGLPIIENMVEAYAKDFGGFATDNFLLFLPACVLGAMLGDCGAAEDIAVKISSLTEKMSGKTGKYWVLMGLSLITAILSFGGVSGFVVIFTIAPICYSIFKKLDIPWHFVIAVAVYGGSMWTAILPGSPAIQNLIPIKYLGTDPKAAPVIGILSAVTCIVFGAWYIWFQLGRNEKRGEGFEVTGELMDKEAGSLNNAILEKSCSNLQFIKAFAPSLVLLIAMNVFNITPFVSLTLGCVVCFALYYNKFKHIGKTLTNGCTSTMKSIMNVSAVVGFGAIVELTPGFKYVVENLDKMPGSPLFQLCLATNIVAGVTASASGGEGIALNAFANKFLQMGVPADQIHRIVNISCYGLDSMPYNGSVINRLNYTRLTVKNGYYHEFILGAVFPFLNSFFAVALASMGLH
jgi:H+/gluconate symporter-like permease